MKPHCIPKCPWPQISVIPRTAYIKVCEEARIPAMNAPMKGGGAYPSHLFLLAVIRAMALTFTQSQNSVPLWYIAADTACYLLIIIIVHWLCCRTHHYTDKGTRKLADEQKIFNNNMQWMEQGDYAICHGILNTVTVLIVSAEWFYRFANGMMKMTQSLQPDSQERRFYWYLEKWDCLLFIEFFVFMLSLR